MIAAVTPSTSAGKAREKRARRMKHRPPTKRPQNNNHQGWGRPPVDPFRPNYLNFRPKPAYNNNPRRSNFDESIYASILG